MPQVRAAYSVSHAGGLPQPTLLCLREAAHVREAQHGHVVPDILLPAGDVSAVPCCARVEATVVAVPQEVHDVVPGEARAPEGISAVVVFRCRGSVVFFTADLA